MFLFFISNKLLWIKTEEKTLFPPFPTLLFNPSPNTTNSFSIPVTSRTKPNWLSLILAMMTPCYTSMPYLVTILLNLSWLASLQEQPHWTNESPWDPDSLQEDPKENILCSLDSCTSAHWQQLQFLNRQFCRRQTSPDLWQKAKILVEEQLLYQVQREPYASAQRTWF